MWPERARRIREHHRASRHRASTAAAAAGRDPQPAPALAAGRGRPGCRHRRTRRAWPAAHRHGRDVLAVPPVPGGRCRATIDWRQSARSRHLFVREQEWEAAESVWIWCDLSRIDGVPLAAPAARKWERAALLTLALAALLVRGGERVALLGGGQRPASRPLRHGARSPAALTQAAGTREPLPPTTSLPRHARLVLLSDFLQPIDGCASAGPVRGPGRARQPDPDPGPRRGAAALRGPGPVRGHGAGGRLR